MCSQTMKWDYLRPRNCCIINLCSPTIVPWSCVTLQSIDALIDSTHKILVLRGCDNCCSSGICMELQGKVPLPKAQKWWILSFTKLSQIFLWFSKAGVVKSLIPLLPHIPCNIPQFLNQFWSSLLAWLLTSNLRPEPVLFTAPFL